MIHDIFNNINSRLNLDWLEEKYTVGYNVTEANEEKLIVYTDIDYKTFVLSDDITACSVFVPFGEEVFLSEPTGGKIERSRPCYFYVFANLREMNIATVHTEALKYEIEAILLKEENIELVSYTDVQKDVVGSLSVGRSQILYPWVVMRWTLNLIYGFNC